MLNQTRGQNFCHNQHQLLPLACFAHRNSSCGASVAEIAQQERYAVCMGELR